LQIPSGEHLFILERDDLFQINFYHSSPGTGTRVATIKLDEVPSCNNVFMTFSWTPEEIKLYLGPRVPNGKLLSATGVSSQKQFRIGKDGGIYQIGDHGVDTMQINVYQDGKAVLQPTAYDAWKNTIRATHILSTGQSDQGYIFESVVTNLTLAILVTGFEAYAKMRFQEIELEGIEPNTDAVINAFISQKGREAGLAEILRAEAKEERKTIIQLIVERDFINFQNYQKCKLAYNKAYDLKFGDLSMQSTSIEKIKKIFTYRHRIIHVSPLLGMLNQANVPPEEPVFPKKELATEAVAVFDKFIDSLHKATLKLRRKD